MTEALEKAGIAAVDKFLDTWNSRDPEAWAGSLNYPHVRPSPFGAVQVAPMKEDYVAAVNYNKVVDSGWDHSEWDYKKVVHTSAKKIHVAGQWSRYNSKGDVILTTPIVYVCTLVDGSWGIQSRFGSDFAHEDIDTSGFATRGLKLVTDFVHNHRNNNKAACAELLNYPHYGIGVGELTETNSLAEFDLTNASMEIESLYALQTGQHSMNVGVELCISNEDEPRSGVLSITNREGHLGIQAWSILNPNDTGESD